MGDLPPGYPPQWLHHAVPLSSLAVATAWTMFPRATAVTCVSRVASLSGMSCRITHTEQNSRHSASLLKSSGAPVVCRGCLRGGTA